MQIVFCSSDNDAQSFQEYFADMPWLAVPFEDGDLRAKLGSRYSVYGIPCFVVIDATGKVLTKSGREAVSSDPTGEKYPWINFSSGFCTLL